MAVGLELQGICRSFPAAGGWARVQVLRQLQLEVREGEAMAVLGANGSGKSTLLRIAAGLILPESGRVCRGPGLSLLLPADERGFYPRLSGRQNLAFYGRLFGVPPTESRRRLEDFYNLLSLGDVFAQRFDRLSSGQKRLLGLALVWLVRPRLILLDEPLFGLDPELARRASEGLRRDLCRAEGAALLFASQQMEVVAALADRAGLLLNGAIGAELGLHRAGDDGGRAVEDVAAFYRERAGGGR